MAKTRPCQRCGKMIPAERVEALPDTRLCLPCSGTVGGDFQRTFQQESLGKTSSLKKNYGGVNVSKTRKNIERTDV